ncbi:MAG: histidine kinase [Armatimonadota bacterium]|nr:histidine kinase [Armatimonadota bacterium]
MDIHQPRAVGRSRQRTLRLLPFLHTRAQVHLVANVLSLVASLLRRHPRAAEDLLAHMGDYLRSRLVPPQALVPLADELDLVLVFVGVERARLGGRLRLEVACHPEARPALLPPLVLQALVENAVRHGIARRVTGGRLRICARMKGRYLHVCVSDDGVGLRRPPPAGAAGWGLATTRLRLAALWGSEAHLRVLSRAGRGTIAAISVPATFASPPGGRLSPAPGRPGSPLAGR